jgi:hypothetical protein
MPVPWLKIFNAVAGISQVVGQVRRSTPPADDEDPRSLTTRPAPGTIEAGLAGVMVAALREAFDRDAARLELERQRDEADRLRAERALRLELLRQTGERELVRQRLLTGVAVAILLGTLLFSRNLLDGGQTARITLGAGWLLLLAALGSAFAAMARVSGELGALDERSLTAAPSSGLPGAAVAWLIIAALAVIAFGVLLA